MQEEGDGLPLEFLNLPAFESTIDVPLAQVSQCFVCQTQGMEQIDAKKRLIASLEQWHSSQTQNTALRRSDEKRSLRTASITATVLVPSKPCHADLNPSEERTVVWG